MPTSHIGQTIYVSDSLPATNTAAGFEALDWEKVSGVEILPQFGMTGENIDVPDLQSGHTIGLKGAQSGIESTMSFHDVPNDDGQETIRELAEAVGDAGRGSVKIVAGTGTDQAPVAGDKVEYAQGYFGSHSRMQGSNATYEGFTVTFKQNYPHIVDVEPAGS